MSLAAFVAVSTLLAARAQDPAALGEELARRIDARQQRVSDLTARFTQTYRSGMLGRSVVETGRLSLKRPGRMRWEYREPETKLFVSDGRRFYFYVPADRQVIVREQAGEQGIAVRLLSGQDSLAGEFEAEMVPSSSELRRLRLTPKRPDPEIALVELEVDAEERIRAIRVRDVQGNESRFEFEQIRENVGLEDRLFRFEIPKGVEVLRG